MTSIHNNQQDDDLNPLDHLLDRGLSSRLTLVLGRNASERGKAISEWLDRRGREYEVLQILCRRSEDDNRDCPQRIFEALAEAGIGKAPPDDAADSETCQARMIRLMNELATLRQDLVVVLRDYQPCERADRVLTFMLEHLPQQVHLYLTCDSVPDLRCIPRLRVRRQLQTIGIGDS